jgi:hypothetical protein
MIRLLLDAGASPNSCESAIGMHAIQNAPEHLETIGALRLLLQSGADPNATDIHGRMALFIAASRVFPNRKGSGQPVGSPRTIPNAETVMTLLEYGASLSIQDKRRGHTNEHFRTERPIPALRVLSGKA